MNQQTQKYYDLASVLIAAGALALTLTLHLLPALLVGLLVYQLVHILSPRITSKRLSGGRAKVVVVALIASATATSIALIIWGIAVFLRGDSGNLAALLQKMVEVLGTSKMALPAPLRGNSG